VTWRTHKRTFIGGGSFAVRALAAPRNVSRIHTTRACPKTRVSVPIPAEAASTAVSGAIARGRVAGSLATRRRTAREAAAREIRAIDRSVRTIPDRQESGYARTRGLTQRKRLRMLDLCAGRSALPRLRSARGAAGPASGHPSGGVIPSSTGSSSPAAETATAPAPGCVTVISTTRSTRSRRSMTSSATVGGLPGSGSAWRSSGSRA